MTKLQFICMKNFNTSAKEEIYHLTKTTRVKKLHIQERKLKYQWEVTFWLILYNRAFVEQDRTGFGASIYNSRLQIYR